MSKQYAGVVVELDVDIDIDVVVVLEDVILCVVVLVVELVVERLDSVLVAELLLVDDHVLVVCVVDVLRDDVKVVVDGV